MAELNLSGYSNEPELNYHIKLPLEDDNSRWFTLCTADTPTNAAEVIHFLMSKRPILPGVILIEAKLK